MTSKILELIQERARLKRRIKEINQELCSHNDGTYRSIGWTGWAVKCNECHKTLESGSWIPSNTKEK